jgi:hypothetical protein
MVVFARAGRTGNGENAVGGKSRVRQVNLPFADQ